MPTPSQAVTSQGVQLQRGNGATPPEGFTLIGEIHTITGPTEKAKQIDVSTVDSNAHEYIAGLLDGGEVKMAGNFIAGDLQQQGLRADMVARTRRNFRLILTDATTNPTTINFAGVVIEFGIKMGVDKQIEFDATLKLTGLATYTYHV